MPFFGDLGKLAETLLDTGRDSNIFFDSTKVCLKTKASNGAAFEFNKEIGAGGAGDADGKVSYKHSSGINMKEVKMDTDGVTSVKAELKGAVDNTTLNMAIKQNPQRGQRDAKGKMTEDSGSLGFKYDDKTVAADCSFDFLAADAPLIKANVVSAVPGVDGAHVGFDMQFKTALDTMPGSLKDKGAHSLTTFPWKVAAQYALSDMQLAAIYDNGKKAGTIKYQQVLASDCAVGAQVDLPGLFGKDTVKPTFTLGGSYNLDPDTTVYGRLESKKSELSLGVAQQLNSKVAVNMSTAVNAADMSNHKFGFGIELSN